MNRGRLFVISAPSGAGKTTILRRVMAALDNLVFSVSHTTRPPRPGEEDGRDYHFVTRARFEEMRASGDFLEWAEVHGNLYGTSRASVEAQMNAGLDVILDIDVQGARQVRALAGLAPVSLFILPPSAEELAKRLAGRGTDSAEVIRRRLDNAAVEMAASSEYDQRIVNDDLERAVAEVMEILAAARRGPGPAGNKG